MAYLMLIFVMIIVGVTVCRIMDIILTVDYILA